MIRTLCKTAFAWAVTVAWAWVDTQEYPTRMHRESHWTAWACTGKWCIPRTGLNNLCSPCNLLVAIETWTYLANIIWFDSCARQRSREQWLKKWPACARYRHHYQTMCIPCEQSPSEYTDSFWTDFIRWDFSDRHCTCPFDLASTQLQLGWILQRMFYIVLVCSSLKEL